MKIIKTNKFNKWAVKSKIYDDALCIAAKEVAAGIYDASYGGCIFKKRVANKGRGKRGSSRVIILYKKSHHSFFVYGFEKSEIANLTATEVKALKLLAKEMFDFNEHEIETRLRQGTLIEVFHE